MELTLPNVEGYPRFLMPSITSVQERFPGVPLVGYEREPDLTVAQAADFEKVQDLRVWIRQV
jgi:hypothetical protein